MLPDIGTPEIIIVVAVILLLFGATKLPTFARSLGRSMRIFKSEIKGIQHDDEPAEETRADGPEPRAKPEPEAEAPQQLAASPSAEASTEKTPADETPADEQTAREPVAEKQ